MGIDPGTATTGFCILEEKSGNKVAAVEYGCIRTSKNESAHKRLSQIHEGLRSLLLKHKPNEVAVEKLFFNKNVKTAMSVSQARGVILLAASQAGLDVAEYTPLEVKMALTGYGRADKNQVQQMVKILLNLKTIPKPDDAADALAVALCHISTNKFNSKVKNAK